jgi:DNA-binding transcriptional regulator YhcF (GntR family)
MNLPGVDPDSPIPLFHQIAEVIRARIEAGELEAGDALEPLRDAARTWGVNLHTVRHAYTALAREGLVETRGSRGTRVAAVPARRESAPPSGTTRFISRMIREARNRHGLDARQLSIRIAQHARDSATGPPEVYVVECSAGQCEAHAREIQAVFDVDAKEWSLERHQEPPPGTILATYFHYNDIRRLWPHRLREIRFVTIAPDPEILGRLPASVKQVLVCERDETTAETIAADFALLFLGKGYRVEPVVTTDPISLLKNADTDTVALIPPRIWFSLGAAARSHDRAFAAKYAIDIDDLKTVARQLDWPEATPEGRAPGFGARG